MIARVCIPGKQWFDIFMRLLALVLAFLSGLVLSLFDSTSNDLLASIPFVWALALAMAHLDTTREHRLSGRTAALLSGLLAGVSVACKLSNGPLAILLPGLWLLSGSSVKTRLTNVAVGGAATAAAFVLAYGYWGWELWTHFGNPIYPFCDACFAPLRSVLGMHP